MYRDVITLFNFHKNTGLWYPTVFSGVDIGVSKASNPTTHGTNNGDTVNILIHCKPDKTLTTADGEEKSYLGAKAYSKCATPHAFVTFKPECDFIFEGEWPDMSPVADEDYESGFYHEMNDNYDGVYMITSASFYGLIPHFEIGGR